MFDRLSRATTSRWALASAVAVLLGAPGVLPVRANGAIPQTGPSTYSTGAPASLLPSSDLLVKGTGDVDGYHLFVADAHRPAAWLALATLDPAPSLDAGWIGRQCVTGDGRFVVATVAPRAAAAAPAGFAHGGVAFAVDVATGGVRALISGVTLAYFSPACGAGSDVVLTSFATADDSQTTIVRLDPATGVRVATITLPGEVTSATPVGDTVYAVDGSELVRIVTPALEVPIAPVGGQAFDLHANSIQGLDFLSTADGQRADVERWTPGGGVAVLGHGPLTSVHLVGGRSGSTAAVGATATASAVPGLRWVASADPVATGELSLDLDGQLLERGGQTQAVAPSAAGSSPTAVVALPAPRPAQPTASAAPAVPSAPSAPPNQTNPSCAVTRNDVHRQITQPSFAQVDWAVQMATRSALIAARTGDPSWNLSAYYPSLDFPLGGVTVPREVLSGIIATESNLSQASWHAARGMAGNPLIGSYYGYDSQTDTWDYNNADCGYGLTQRTDGMHVADTQFSNNVQLAVGLDYAENVAAGAATLVDKWNQLRAIGVTANNGDGSKLENWYFALWAYNTGIHPADSNGFYGLGWTNNPINPSFPPNRSPYRTVTTADSGHPSDWPYQEQVFGWIEVPFTDPNGVNAYAPSASYLEMPDHAQFCDASDSCDRTQACATSQSTCNSTTNQPCTRAAIDFHCWWHRSASWGGGCTGGDCTPATWSLPTTASEPPTPANPYPAVCSLAASSSPAPASGALVVDDEADGVPTDWHMSVNTGCPFSPSWNSTGFFSFTLGTNAPIDLHQLGVGFDGHMTFTHEIATSDANWKVTGTWTPDIPSTGGGYDIWVFIPSDGATATDAQYVIDDGFGNQYQPVPVNQDAYSNQWVSLGSFPLGPGATVTLTNANANGATSNDLSFDAMAFEKTSPGLQSAYVAMGDSYSSGQGDPPFTNDSADGCNRSVEGYPTKLVGTYSTIYNGKTAFVACSGATTEDVLTGRDGEGPQTTWLTGSTRLVTITIGGNDVGFGPILTSCATGTGCGASANPTLDAQIQQMQPRLRALYTQMALNAPNATIVVLTYPQIFPIDGANCTASVVGAMSKDDINWARQEWSAFNTVIKQATLGVPGVQVLDEENAFNGHTACDANADVNGIIVTALNNSFHPNWRGDDKMASDLEAMLHLP